MNAPPAQWTADALVRLVTINVLSGAAIATTHVLASGRAEDEQFAFANVAVAALVIAGCANVNWLLRGRRTVGLRYDAVRRQIAETSTVAPATAAPAGWVDQAFVAGEGLSRFHRAGCALAEGRNWQLAAREEHERSRRKPCGVCRP